MESQIPWGNILSMKLDKYIADSTEEISPPDKQVAALFFDYIFDNLSEPFKECFWKAAKDVIDTKLAVEGKQWPSKTE